MLMATWTCPECGASERQKSNTIEVAHRCPRARRIVAMVREDDEEE